MIKSIRMAYVQKLFVQAVVKESAVFLFERNDY